MKKTSASKKMQIKTMCDYIVIYNEKHIFGLPPLFLAHSSPNPWNFLSEKNNRSIICYNICSSVISALK